MSRFPAGLELAALLGGAVCVAAVGLVLMGIALSFVWLVVRRRSSPAAREEALEALGYQRTDRGWSMPLYGTRVLFDERGPGFRWTIRLPRYNTLTLRVEEREGGEALAGQPLLTERADLDARFVMAAERSAQSWALVSNRAFGNMMLGMPFLSLSLQGDELVLADPELRGLGRLSGGPVALGTPKAIAAERELHRSVAALVTALFDALYSKQTGTLLPEHR